MKNIKDIVLFKGKKAKLGKVHTMDIKVHHVLECFFPKKGNEYLYLGYAFYYIENGKISEIDKLLIYFYECTDKEARPFWCPKFILRLLHLFGNDNSLVRMRNYRLQKLFIKLTKGIKITDTKMKFDEFRIYGYFNEHLEEQADIVCKQIDTIVNENQD